MSFPPPSNVNFLMPSNRSVEMGPFIYLSGHVSTYSLKKGHKSIIAQCKKIKNKNKKHYTPHTLMPIHYTSESTCETVFMMLGGPQRQDMDLGIEFISRVHHIW